MTGQITVTGMVLSTMPVGDYDKRLTILTKERGKISAFAKGARRPNSVLLGCSQPFSFGEFTLYEGRSSYNVVGAEISNYFSELRLNVEQVYYGLYFCEFTEYITREENDEKEVLKLLYQSLRALSKPEIGISLVRYIFELKMFYLMGEGPQVFGCVCCKAKENLILFSSRQSGTICKQCKSQAYHGQMITESTLYTLQVIALTPVEKLYHFTVTKAVLKELEKLTNEYRKEHIEYTMKSLEMIELLNKTEL